MKILLTTYLLVASHGLTQQLTLSSFEKWIARKYNIMQCTDFLSYKIKITKINESYQYFYHTQNINPKIIQNLTPPPYGNIQIYKTNWIGHTDKWPHIISYYWQRKAGQQICLATCRIHSVHSNFKAVSSHYHTINMPHHKDFKSIFRSLVISSIYKSIWKCIL